VGEFFSLFVDFRDAGRRSAILAEHFFDRNGLDGGDGNAV